jgi:hypothetical protein
MVGSPVLGSTASLPRLEATELAAQRSPEGAADLRVDESRSGGDVVAAPQDMHATRPLGHWVTADSRAGVGARPAVRVVRRNPSMGTRVGVSPAEVPAVTDRRRRAEK